MGFYISKVIIYIISNLYAFVLYHYRTLDKLHFDFYGTTINNIAVNKKLWFRILPIRMFRFSNRLPSSKRASDDVLGGW